MADSLRPSTAEELREIIAAAVAEKRPLEISGAGSKRGLGRPVEAEVEVALGGLRGIDLYEPAELVMSAQVGTPLAEIEAQLAANQQELAFEPPDFGPLLGETPGRGTIGGVIACNLAGPRRIKSGAARDHFLGVQAVTGRGDLIKSGGRVMKNVTGYDLCKLLAGSYGTLVAMTQVTFKVLPAAEETLTLVLSGASRDELFRALRTAMGSPYDVASAACLPADVGGHSAVAEIARARAELAAIRIEGPGPSVRYRAEALKNLLAAPIPDVGEIDGAASNTFWREVRDVALLPQEAEALWRVSVPPAAGPEVLDVTTRELAADWLADWSGGLIWLAVHEDRDGGAALIRRAIAGAGGHATLCRGPAELRARIDVFQPQTPPLARLTARVKESFDPERILNRGRMHAGL